jgi:hypothetical protein
VVSSAIEQRGRHLGVGEDARPFAEGQIGGDEDRGTLIKPTDEVEQELAAGLGEGQITEFLENDEVYAATAIETGMFELEVNDANPVRQRDPLMPATRDLVSAPRPSGLVVGQSARPSHCRATRERRRHRRSTAPPSEDANLDQTRS